MGALQHSCSFGVLLLLAVTYVACHVADATWRADATSSAMRSVHVSSLSEKMAGCTAATTPFPPTVGEVTGPFNFTGDALPPDLMANAKFYANGHPEALISHGDVRARVCVTSAGASAVSVQLPWRRRDLNASQKDFIIRHAATGREVTNKRTLPGHSRFTGSIAFEPSAGPGEYHVYWLVHNCTCLMGYCGPSVKTVFPLMRGAPSAEAELWWEQRQRSRVALPTAQYLGTQPRTEFANFTEMELVATADEAQRAAGADSFLLIPGDRMSPLRLTNFSNGDFPIGWLEVPAIGDKRHDLEAAFTGVARPGEWFALQLGVWARNTSVEVLSVNISGDAELSTNFSCMSLGGNDYSGQAFTKLWYLPAGRLSSLWMGVQVPAAGTSASTLKGQMAVILRTSNDTATINIPVSIEVSGAPIVNAGDNEPSKLSRLRWLDSRIGISDRVPKPYTPIDCSDWKTNRTLRILGRSLSIGLSGMPLSIAATRAIGSEIFSVAATGGWTWNSAGPELANQSQSSVSWVASGSNPAGITIQVVGTLSFEGYVDFALTVSSASGAATTLSGFAVDAVLRAPYLAGLGRAGRKLGAAAWPLANLPPTGPAKSGCDVNNSLPLVFNSSGPAAPILWTGDVDGGLRIKYKGPGTAWDNPAYTGVSSWSNSGLGVITVDYASSGADSSQSDAKDLVRISASTGLLHLTPTNPSRSFHLDLCITPFKQRAAQLNSHFQSRYFQIGYPDHHMYTPEEVAATGATIATIHQGVDSEINPYINWPFDPQSVALQTNFSTRFAALSNPNHTIQNRFKLYYTARELTNHVAELFPLRALNGEILQCNGLSAEGVINGGPSAWLLEHLVEDFCPCWQQNLGNGEFDAAVCDIGISRWSNYYLEGLRHMTENAPHTSGIYFDGINFGRGTMLRIRRTLDEAIGPTAAIDFHSGNTLSPSSGGPALQYMHMLPFVDSLWFGESFRYNSPADYWLTEISGLPYGLSADMLGGDCTTAADCSAHTGPNPFRGMVFGMTGRFDESTYASRIWHLWDRIRIENMTMIGWFDKEPAVSVLYNDSLLAEGCNDHDVGNWSGPYGGYFGGCAGPGQNPPPPCLEQSSLAAAEEACDKMPFAQCAGITKEGASAYQLRRGPALVGVPGAEVSWARNCSLSPSSCPKATAPIPDPIRATAYVLKGERTLIVLANLCDADQPAISVQFHPHLLKLGLPASSVKSLTAPFLGGFTPRNAFGQPLHGSPNLQEAAEFPVGGVIPVQAARGVFLMVEPES